MTTQTDAALDVPELIPARMLNEFAYCPRLAYLEWVQGEWEENVHTVDGKYKHRVVDEEKGTLPEAKTTDHEPQTPDEAPERIHAQSVWLSAPNEGLTAKMDLLEGQGERLTPVDYKRGEVPETPERSWFPDRVQLCVQGLVLRENGYSADSGILYYAASKTRVEVPFDSELVATTRRLASELCAVAQSGTIPPPLEDSPKCVGCSLVGICLPDETSFLAQFPAPEGLAPKPGAPGSESPTLPHAHTPTPLPRSSSPTPSPDEPLRRLLPPRDDTLPLYVQEQGAYLGKRGERFEVKKNGTKIGDAKIFETPQVSLFGNVQISTQALNEMLNRGIPVCFFTTGGWFHGMANGMPHKNVELRQRQYAVAAEPEPSLGLARRFVAGKIANCRTLLKRNHPEPPKRVLDDLAAGLKNAENAENVESLLGIEGAAARLYFENLPGMLKPRSAASGAGTPGASREDEPGPDGFPGEEPRQEEPAFTFDFNGRNRRPPRDPINAMLSYAYSLLAKELTVTAMAVGFDPLLGFFHRPRYGRPALALDLMEEFRPLIADSVVLRVVNNGILKPGDFIRRGPSCALKPLARKKFIQAYEGRLDTLVTHPLFGYRVSYRRILQVQARLLARTLLGEIPEYPTFRTR